MKKTLLLLTAILVTGLIMAQTSVFINEIHYDNSGADANEGVEVAGPAATDLTGWKIIMHNGSNGAPYDSVDLTATLADQQNGFGTVWTDISGLQNGSPDGVALQDASNNIVQFLSYEGSFDATAGYANGMTSVDIGVSEGSTTTTQSMQLTGQGENYEDFYFYTQIIVDFITQY